MRAAIVLFAITIAAGAFAPAAGAQTTTTTTTTPGQVTGSGLVVRLAEVPTDRRDDQRANQYIVDHVEPGATIRRKIEVRNDTDQPLGARLYLGGAQINGGAFTPKDDGANDIVSWGSVTPAEVSLASGQTVAAVVELRVPATAREGERYGAVWAELPGAASPSGISTVNRVGIRVYLSVGEGGEPETRFSLPRFTATRDADGRPGVDIRACNDGGRAVDLAGELELTDGPGGISAGPFPSDTGTTLAPGECGIVAVRLDPEIPRGPWLATARLRSGNEQREASARITFPAAPGTAAAPVKAKPKDVTGTAGGRLALLLALLLLLLALLLLFLLWRRRKKRQEEEDAAGRR